MNTPPPAPSLECQRWPHHMQKLVNTGWWLFIPANEPRPVILTEEEMIRQAIDSIPTFSTPSVQLLPPRMFRAYTELLK